MQIAILLCLLLCGCQNKLEGFDKNELIQVTPYTELTKTKKFKSPNVTTSLTLEHKNEFEPGAANHCKDSLIEDKQGYFLVDKYLARIDFDTMKTRTTELARNYAHFDRIAKSGKTIFLYHKNKSDKALMLADGTQKELKFDGLVANIIPYNNYIIVITTNGLCISYDYVVGKETWKNLPHSQNGFGLKASNIFRDNIVLIDAKSRLVLIDLDNGMIDGYVEIADQYSGNNHFLAVTKSGICGMSGENLLVGLLKNGKVDYKKLRIKDLKKITSSEEYIILQQGNDLLITNVELLHNSKYISRVKDAAKHKNLLVHRKTLCVVKDKTVECYDIATGKLLQTIENDQNILYSAIHKNKINLVDRNSRKVYG